LSSFISAFASFERQRGNEVSVELEESQGSTRAHLLVLLHAHHLAEVLLRQPQIASLALPSRLLLSPHLPLGQPQPNLAQLGLASVRLESLVQCATMILSCCERVAEESVETADAEGGVVLARLARDEGALVGFDGVGDSVRSTRVNDSGSPRSGTASRTA